jgi:hypothetical protein
LIKVLVTFLTIGGVMVSVLAPTAVDLQLVYVAFQLSTQHYGERAKLVGSESG